MEHENQAVGGAYALAGRLKMSSRNIGLADPVIGEKAIGCLRLGPILADQRNALPTEPPIRAISLRNCPFSRSSAKWHPAISWSNHAAPSSSIAPLPNRCRTKNHTPFAPGNRAAHKVFRFVGGLRTKTDAGRVDPRATGQAAGPESLQPARTGG